MELFVTLLFSLLFHRVISEGNRKISAFERNNKYHNTLQAMIAHSAVQSFTMLFFVHRHLNNA